MQKFSPLNLPKITPNLLEVSATTSHAMVVFEELKSQIQEFETTLDTNQDVGLMLANFGQSFTLIVETVVCAETHLIVFKGTSNGRPHTLTLFVRVRILLRQPPVKPP